MEQPVSQYPTRLPQPSDLHTTSLGDLHEGDSVFMDGQVRTITALIGAGHPGTSVLVRLDEDEPRSYPAGTTFEVVETSYWYLTEEEGMALAPHRMREEEWVERFQPITDADGSLSPVDDIPEGVADRYVWTQIEGDEAYGWRDFALVPGPMHVNRVNYVICRVPWTDADADVEVNWNWG